MAPQVGNVASILFEATQITQRHIRCAFLLKKINILLFIWKLIYIHLLTTHRSKALDQNNFNMRINFCQILNIKVSQKNRFLYRENRNASCLSETL